MTEPNQELLADESIARVTLAGVQWPVPRLALKQNNEITPILFRRMAALSALQAGQSAYEALSPELLTDLSTIVYWGLTRGHKELTRSAFDDLPVSSLEILTAVVVVGEQGGLIERRRVPANGVAPPLAPAPTNSPTG